MKIKALKKIAICLFMVLSFGKFSMANPQMRYEDKIRIREAISISNRFGEEIWEGISKVPFVVLLVYDSVEFLINHPYPSSDFKLLENDTILKIQIFYRPRQFSDKLLATFPAVNGVNCIVVGTPEKTNKNSTEWIITLLHEHFHQYEYTYPDYYKSVNNLELSGGDQTGMWQLNYAFAYDSTPVVEQYKTFTSALYKSLSYIDKKGFKKHFKSYLKERRKFKQLLKPADFRYFSFQVWQEGIARYTEYKFLQALANYKPSNEIKQLSDFVSFKSYKDKFKVTEEKALVTLKLNVDKRVCFYAIGFAEGLLLDKVNPKWRNKFLKNKFYLENYYKKDNDDKAN